VDLSTNTPDSFELYHFNQESSPTKKMNPVWTQHKIFVTAVQAKGIKQTNVFSNDSDSYVSIKHKLHTHNGVQGVTKTSAVQKKTLSPEWNEVFEFVLSEQPESDVFFVSLQAKATIGSDKTIGRVEIPASLLLFRPGQQLDCWFKLMPEKASTNDLSVPGTIRLVFKLVVDEIQFPKSEQEIVHPKANERKESQSQLVQCPICQNLGPQETMEQHFNQCMQQASELFQQQARQSQLLQQQKAAAAAPPLPVIQQGVPEPRLYPSIVPEQQGRPVAQELPMVRPFHDGNRQMVAITPELYAQLMRQQK